MFTTAIGGSVQPVLTDFNGNDAPTVLALSDADRTTAVQTFRNTGLAAAAYEAGPDVSPFTSKFDAVLQGTATLTDAEHAGYDLFTGKANCSQCHDTSGPRPLFTNWTTANTGIPKNAVLSFYQLTEPDTYGFIVNPSGQNYTDPGLGGFLASPSNTNPDWKALAPSFIGRFQVATVRNTARQPSQLGFSKAFTHNGYFKTLKDLVHFYNTRDVLPACSSDVAQNGLAPPIGVTCWPAPEVPQTVNHMQTGDVSLSDEEENEIVAFLSTLSDGYTSAGTAATDPP